MTTLDSRWVPPDHATTDRADYLIAVRQECHVQTLERSYLLRINGVVVERPQHMLMRVAVGIHKEVQPGPLAVATIRWSQSHWREKPSI